MTAKSDQGSIKKATCNNPAARMARNGKLRSMVVSGKTREGGASLSSPARLRKTGRPLRIDVQFRLTKQVKRIGMKAARHESLDYIAGGSAGDVSHDTRSKIDEANRTRVCSGSILFRRAGKTIKAKRGIPLTKDSNAQEFSELFRQI